MDSSERMVKRDTRIAWRVIGDEALLVDPASSLIYPLNGVGARIWELLDGTRSAEAIAAAISQEFCTDEADVISDVGDFISDLLKNGLAVAATHSGMKV